jgi:cell shape-determining protein MreC
MNDKDKEAFEKYLDESVMPAHEIKLFETMNERQRIRFGMEKAWKAACEYKEKQFSLEKARLREIEIEVYRKLEAENAFLKENINGTKMKQMNDRIEDLLAKNKKLREALDLCKQEATRPAYVITICKEALKEVGEE